MLVDSSIGHIYITFPACVYNRGERHKNHNTWIRMWRRGVWVHHRQRRIIKGKERGRPTSSESESHNGITSFFVLLLFVLQLIKPPVRVFPLYLPSSIVFLCSSPDSWLKESHLVSTSLHLRRSTAMQMIDKCYSNHLIKTIHFSHFTSSDLGRLLRKWLMRLWSSHHQNHSWFLSMSLLTEEAC